ncbi:hypothetical protein ACP70R_020927 [Stipagrostis hirtigluma subsp. patula]
MCWFYRKGPSGFSGASTAEEVTAGVDGRGLVAVITGASSGIGWETARVLALRGVHVVMAVRNISAGLAAKEGIVAKIPGARVDVLELDLSSMASVRRFAAEFESLSLPLKPQHSHNAGVLTSDCKLSCDGLELHFASSHIGHFLLTNLLLENMKNTCRDSSVDGRIINVSSIAHMFDHGGICFDKIKNPTGYLDALPLKGSCCMRSMCELNNNERNYSQGQEEGVNISANAVYPGVILTNIFRNKHILNALMNSARKIFSRSVEQGAATTCYVAMHPQVKGISGKYFSNSNIANPSLRASDAKLAKKLWQFSLQTVS